MCVPTQTPEHLALWEQWRPLAAGHAYRVWKRLSYLQASVTKLVRLSRVSLDDLRQAALMALWKAVVSYDPARGVPLKVYFAICVRRGVQSEAWRQQFWGLNANDYAYRRGQKLPRCEPLDPSWDAARQDPPPGWEDREVTELLIACLPSGRLRGVARRYFLEGLHIDTIAHQLGVKRSRAQQVVAKARRIMAAHAGRLKSQWGEDYAA